jgi:hypothetical protein
MIKDEQIPDQVIAAFDHAFLEERQSGWTLDMAYRHAFAAGLAAWPGAWHVDAVDFEPKLILPLTQEKGE